MKSLYEISWQLTEEEYRQSRALSYSTLAKFKRSGFNEINHLFDKVESPSLTFGSAVDSIITGGEDEFNERFFVAEFPAVPDSIIPIVKSLYNEYKDTFSSLYDIPDKCVIAAAAVYNYQNNWKPETRAKVIKEKAAEYYKLLYIAGDKTILSTDIYNDICNSVDALKNSPATKWYFSEDNPWEEVERFYQLKFKAKLNGIWYRCMADLIIVDHKNKTIIPVDLKTSFKPEWDFFKSFLDWDYHIQARLYWRIIRAVLDNDPVFREYKLEDYRFIVVNKSTLKPLVWKFEKTQARGDLEYGTLNKIILPDPESIGRTLYTYLSESHRVPIGIDEVNPNSIDYWINTL